MWKNAKDCRFLGGKKVHQKMFKCKSGQPHVWAKITKCVRGPMPKKGGFNYEKASGKQTHHYVKIVKKGHITHYKWVKNHKK